MVELSFNFGPSHQSLLASINNCNDIIRTLYSLYSFRIVSVYFLCIIFMYLRRPIHSVPPTHSNPVVFCVQKIISICKYDKRFYD
jgi:hypothetical protein